MEIIMMPIALLDSNIIIAHVTGGERISLDHGTVALSTITIFELFRLPGISPTEETEISAIISLTQVFSVSEKIAHIAAALSRTKPSIRPMDLLIAATALDLEIPLVTKNLKDFKKVPNLTVRTHFA